MENIKTLFRFVPGRRDLGNSSTNDEFGHKNIRTLIIVITCSRIMYIIIVNRCHYVAYNWSRILYIDKRTRGKYEIAFNFYDRGNGLTGIACLPA